MWKFTNCNYTDYTTQKITWIVVESGTMNTSKPFNGNDLKQLWRSSGSHPPMRSKIEGNSLTSKTCQALKVFRTSANHQIASHLSSRQDFSMVCNGLHLPAFSPNSLLYRKSWVWASHKPLWEKFQKVQLDGHPIQTILQLNSVSESQKQVASAFRRKGFESKVELVPKWSNNPFGPKPLAQLNLFLFVEAC